MKTAVAGRQRGKSGGGGVLVQQWRLVMVGEGDEGSGGGGGGGVFYLPGGGTVGYYPAHMGEPGGLPSPTRINLEEP
jgi:hypothetical protein